MAAWVKDRRVKERRIEEIAVERNRAMTRGEESKEIVWFVC